MIAMLIKQWPILLVMLLPHHVTIAVTNGSPDPDPILLFSGDLGPDHHLLSIGLNLQIVPDHAADLGADPEASQAAGQDRPHAEELHLFLQTTPLPLPSTLQPLPATLPLPLPILRFPHPTLLLPHPILLLLLPILLLLLPMPLLLLLIPLFPHPTVLPPQRTFLPLPLFQDYLLPLPPDVIFLTRHTYLGQQQNRIRLQD